MAQLTTGRLSAAERIPFARRTETRSGSAPACRGICAAPELPRAFPIGDTRFLTAHPHSPPARAPHAHLGDDSIHRARAVGDALKRDL